MEKIKPRVKVLVAAISGNHKEIYEFLISKNILHKKSANWSIVLLASTISENFEFLTWYRENVKKIDEFAIKPVLESDKLSVAEWILEGYSNLLEKSLGPLCKCVARTGDLEKLKKYAVDQDGRFFSENEIPKNAGLSGNLK